MTERIDLSKEGLEKLRVIAEKALARGYRWRDYEDSFQPESVLALLDHIDSCECEDMDELEQEIESLKKEAERLRGDKLPHALVTMFGAELGRISAALGVPREDVAELTPEINAISRYMGKLAVRATLRAQEIESLRNVLEAAEVADNLHRALRDDIDCGVCLELKRAIAAHREEYPKA